MKRFLLSVIVFLVLIGVVGCSNKTIKETKENWEESPTLIREVIVTDYGQTEDFIFRIGDNWKLGFGEYGPFIAGENLKKMYVAFLGRTRNTNTTI